jgi:hypothetical protein
MDRLGPEAGKTRQQRVLLGKDRKHQVLGKDRKHQVLTNGTRMPIRRATLSGAP